MPDWLPIGKSSSDGDEDRNEKVIKAQVDPPEACEEIGGKVVEENGKTYCYIRRFKFRNKPEVEIDPIEVLVKRSRPERPEL